MGMGYAAASAYVISDKNLQALCRQAYDRLDQLLVQAKTNWLALARYLSVDDPIYREDTSGDPDQGEELDEQTLNELVQAWRELQEDFDRVTKRQGQSLSLWLGVYDEDCGDRYDDFEGDTHFFSVGEFTRLTPAGEAFKHLIERKAWVTFG